MKLADLAGPGLYEEMTEEQIEDAHDLSEWIEGEMNDIVEDLVQMGLPYSEENGDEFPFWVQAHYYKNMITIESTRINVNRNALVQMVDTDDEELKKKMEKRVGKKEMALQTAITDKFEGLMKNISAKLKKMGATGYIEKSGEKHDLDWIPTGMKTFRVLF